ncbi:NAD(P)H-dependent glycerol-3-phosphate dehydrogenase [Limibacter armeniacum]|uniref:NAD(P)H-dependent glycerol-3-phosphate dehydrogenase n=1 Tax=Limibacter armeniacum TaxID=466084 RepID=UPI002FE55A8C
MSTENYSTDQGNQIQIKRVAVIGGGSWATALIKILTENGETNINWWLRNTEDISHIRAFHSNPRYLSSVKLNSELVHPFEDIKEAVNGVDAILLAVPAAFIQEALSPLTAEDFKDKYVISSIKGMIPEMNILVTEYIETQYNVPHKNVGVIGGPCHAEEVAMEKQAYLTLSSSNKKYALELARIMRNRYINTTTVKDLYGVEYCAVIKNIIAISCGIAHGLGYGDNFQAVLVSNSMKEIRKFLKEVYKVKRDLTASAYLGDLLVTTYSQFSRNRTFGNMIGRGYSVKAAQLEMNMIAEGYYAVKAIHEIAKQHEGLEMPITKAVYHILYDRISPIVEFRILKEQLK